MTRARVVARLGRRQAAVEDFTRAIDRLPAPRPEHYIERAQVQAADGRVDDALQGLDEGIARLGPLVTLELPAIDLELSRKAYDAALGRLDRLATQSARQETWLMRRGEILDAAGRTSEARVAYQQALAALQTLPPYRRNVKSTTALEQKLMARLGQRGKP